MLTGDEYNKLYEAIYRASNSVSMIDATKVKAILKMYTGIKTVESSNLDSELNQLKADIKKLEEIVFLKKEIKRLKELEKEADKDGKKVD